MKLSLPLFTAASLASGHMIKRQTNSSTTPLPPSQDPWYTEPEGFADYAPGTVFKVRDAPGLVTAIANTSAAYQMLYRTTDSQYRPTWAVTTLLLPIDWESSSKDKLLSYQIPYDSAALDASPSYALYTGGSIFGPGEITTALGRGYAVVTADYEGPLASFTAGVMSGHATLDSVRAAFVCPGPEVGLYENSTTYALWGYSGGALAGEWATELQVQYAPELTFAGAALGGLTPNVSSVLLTINGTIYAGLAPSGILGLASQYSDAEAYLEDQLVDLDATYNKANFNAARNRTLLETIGAYAFQNIALYFRDGFEALLSPIAQRIINRDGVMGYHGVPEIPLFVYKAIADEISVVADTDTLIERYCGVGATIRYERNTASNHATELNLGRARALDFLDSIFSKTYNATGCSIVNVTVSS